MSRDAGRHRPPGRHRPARRRTAARAISWAALGVLSTVTIGASLIGVVETAGPGTPREAAGPPGGPDPRQGAVLLAPVDAADRANPAAQRGVNRAPAAGVVPQRVLTDSAAAAAGLGEAVRVGAFSLDAGVRTALAGREQVADAAAAERLHRPILEGTRTSSYGWRWGRMHEGMDIAADHGTPLYAVGPGTVTATGYNPGLGNHVKVTLEDDTVLVYGHLSTVAVEVDDVVVGGDVLGAVGSTGRSTGAHLHFEVRVGDEALDPGPWLTERFGTTGW